MFLQAGCPFAATGIVCMMELGIGNSDCMGHYFLFRDSEQNLYFWKISACLWYMVALHMVSLRRKYKLSGMLPEDDLFHMAVVLEAAEIAPSYVEVPGGRKIPQYSPT